VTSTTGPRTLAELAPDKRAQRFARLQTQMPEVWRAMGLNEHRESVVVVPSVTIDRVGEGSGSLMQAYEERFLFLLLLLQEPRLRMVYVTSTPIAPSIIEYYLALLPAVIPSHARARLSLVAVQDGSPRPLTAKLLERPRLVEHIRSLIPDRRRSHLIPYNTTPLERDLALGLGIPMYGADPQLFHLGTKSGCRRIFAEEGVRHPIGFEDLHGFDEVVDALARLRAAGTGADEALVKLTRACLAAATRSSIFADCRPRARPMSYRSCASVPGPCGSSALTCHSTPMSPSSLNAVASSRSGSPASSSVAPACSFA
jgi:hypothetical protein